MASGIYQIRNLADGKRYVGSAVDLAKRWNRHLHYLRRNGHHSPHLQRAFNKFGESALSFETIELCDPAVLIEREQAAFDLLLPEYNVEKVAGSRLGRQHSPETRAKMSAAKIGRATGAPSAATRQKISEAQQGKKRGPYKPRTAEHAAKIAAAHRGSKRGPYKPRAAKTA